MRVAVIAALAAGILIIGAGATRADNQSVSGAVLCLAGQAAGQRGGSACSGYMSEYFSIRVFKGGSFKSGDTSSERGNFLNECSSAPSSTRSSVNSQYGRQEIGP